MNKSNVLVSLLVALVVSLGVSSFHSVPKLGGGIWTVLQQFSQGIELDNSASGSVRGTKLLFLKTGTCSLITSGSIAATSTGSLDCAISGIRSGDLVDINLAASTTVTSQFAVKSSQASTTNGFATVQLINLTGAARDPASVNGFGSSTVYKVWRVSNTY